MTTLSDLLGESRRMTILRLLRNRTAGLSCDLLRSCLESLGQCVTNESVNDELAGLAQDGLIVYPCEREDANAKITAHGRETLRKADAPPTPTTPAPAGESGRSDEEIEGEIVHALDEHSGDFAPIARLAELAFEIGDGLMGQQFTDPEEDGRIRKMRVLDLLLAIGAVHEAANRRIQNRFRDWAKGEYAASKTRASSVFPGGA